MALPSTATVFATTPGGINYQVIIPNGYKEQYASDANQIVVRLLVSWADSTEFLAEIHGWTEWDGSAAVPSTTLQRQIPLACPYLVGGTQKLYCQSAELVSTGAEKDRAAWNDAFLDNWPELDWCLYECTFRRFPYKVLSDADLPFPAATGAELGRYVHLRRKSVGRERRKPGYVFEYERTTGGGIWDPTDEVGFVPDITQNFWVTWLQIPEGAVPDAAIDNCLASVNASTVRLGGKDRLPGTLLFRGLEQPIEPYAGSDGGLYYDLVYLFDSRSIPNPAFPGSGPAVFGWNHYRRNDGTYATVRVRGVAGDPPPYAPKDHRTLFQPGA